MLKRDLGFLIGALDQSNDGILVTDADLESHGPRIVYVNAAYERMSGYSSAELLGQTPRLMQGPATDRGTLDRLKAALARGESFHAETFNYRKGGVPYRVEWDITPVRDDDGAIRWFMSIQRDVTARHEASDALNRVVAAMRRSNERLSEVGNVLAHDLQEPLTVVRGYLDLLKVRHEAVLGNSVQYIDTAIKGVDRMSERIRGLLTEALRQDDVMDMVPLAPVVETVISDLYPQIQQIGATIDIGALPTVYARRHELGEVFHNLVSNAIKYRHPDRPLHVAIAGDKLHDALVQVVVADNGLGISSAARSRIFDVGGRGDGHDTVAGTGFGLAYVRRSVERYGGKIDVNSRPGEGASFILMLPTV